MVDPSFYSEGGGEGRFFGTSQAGFTADIPTNTALSCFSCEDGESFDISIRFCQRDCFSVLRDV